jgi:hypothetical protein
MTKMSELQTMKNDVILKTKMIFHPEVMKAYKTFAIELSTFRFLSIAVLEQ